MNKINITLISIHPVYSCVKESSSGLSSYFIPIKDSISMNTSI